MIPEHAPFSPDQRQALNGLLAGFDPSQRWWLGGFLSASSGMPAVAAAPASKTPLTVLYGTESGNSEALAAQTVKAAKKKGFKAVLKNMADCQPSDLEKVENLLVIVSTWGEGDPPEAAEEFYKTLMESEADFSKVKFSVCALGDTSYERFCETGKQVDARLEKLGGQRVAPRVDCDVDYEELSDQWVEAAFKALAPEPVAAAPVAFAAPAVAGVEYGKKKPFPSELLDKVLLNGEGSMKETWHYEFSLEGSGLVYQPGDALAVVAKNAPDMVEGILSAAKLTGNEEVVLKGGETKVLADALREDLEITVLSKAILKKLLAVAPSDKLQALLGDESKEELKSYLWGRWIADAVRDFAPNGLKADELVSIFRKMPPRLYSIASSPLAHPDEVHLTIASVRYEFDGQLRKGVASTYLADLVEKGGEVELFVQPNKNFRLPASDETPIIMVGPGTGVAPFRSFVEHRGESGSNGGSWLIFGDQRYSYDFLYQLEWQDHLASGALSKLDVAFSRDQPEKVYVQDKMREKAAELYQWLQKGAHFYVCGDASRMAHDVHEALLDIVEQEGGMSREEATEYVAQLKKEKRYQRDVY
ncbi:assimilatory sulfite reductase (NADPH) flavoprotein subunit [Roseibacillus persicicus]|uniref:assimilatory sulfite reductase (NADPH) flavoprotein subunit n=1 Tax=Roseibacillus persicicus TaxID=454148 RepID=UPI00280C5909|nr:assimilatory sulfite reductase (NADPH) flavoprotein subunit [Roseibacillus persicicus]MDQ8191119.1 assimilatory sulfite reductase (NADPH) flavoprotein subunit [Roseibacillus persicicus]